MKLFKFAIFWWITFWINLWLTYVLDTYTQLWIYVSYGISIITVIFLNFIFSLKFTFKTKYNHNILLKYLSSTIIFALINYSSVSLYNYLFWKEYLYIFISFVILIIFFSKFYIYDKLIFKKNKNIW